MQVGFSKDTFCGLLMVESSDTCAEPGNLKGNAIVFFE